MAPLLFVITSLRYGGAEGQLVKLMTGLAARGWNVDVAIIIPVNDYSEVLANNGITIHFLDSHQRVNTLGILWRLHKLVRAHRPRIIISFLYHADILSRLTTVLTRVPVMISSYRNERFGGKLREIVMRLTVHIPAAFVANFSSAGRSLVDRKLAHKDKLYIIPNAVAVPEGTVAEREVPRLDVEPTLARSEKFVWVAVGRLEPQKDYFSLLKALAQLNRDDFVLYICGSGNLEIDLKVYCEEQGLSNIVHFLGQRNDIAEVLKLADGFVMSSAWEGMPNALLEALAHGVPAVATRVGGIPDLMSCLPGEFTVAPEAPDQLATAMLSLMELPPATRRELGAIGRRFVRERYSFEALVASWELLLRRFT